MKFFNFLIFILASGLFFSSCEKDYSAENGNSSGLLLSDAAGECMPIVVNGSYVKDTVLKASNYAEVQVNFSQSGSYFITTDTVNGYSFRGSGAVSTAGISTVRLTGSGKPIAVSGGDVFQVRFGTGTCDFVVVVSATGGGGGTAAVFTLAGSPTACTGATQTPNFYATIPANASNTVTVFANVTTGGTYTINAVTAPANGLTFSGSGTLAAGANQPITLTGSGTPSTAGSIPYTLSTATPASNCGFNLTVQAAPAQATYTIDCTGATTAGTYQQNIPATSSNTVTISATATGAGSYSITTPSVNGISFSGNGVFSGAGTQPVVLTATGTPLATGTFTFPATASTGGSTCTFTVTFSGGTPPPTGTDSLSAFVNGVFTTFLDGAVAFINNTTVPGYTTLFIAGDSTFASNEGVGLSLGTNSGTITPGTYTVNQGPAILVGGRYADAAGTEYVANSNPPTVQTPAFTITITSITSLRVRGTFSGPLKNNNGAGPGVKTIANGYFDLAL